MKRLIRKLYASQGSPHLEIGQAVIKTKKCIRHSDTDLQLEIILSVEEEREEGKEEGKRCARLARSMFGRNAWETHRQQTYGDSYMVIYKPDRTRYEQNEEGT